MLRLWVMVTYNIQCTCSNNIICYKQYISILCLFAEISEAFSTLPVLTMKTGFTAGQNNTVNTTDSQQFSRYTGMPSDRHTTASDQQHHSISPSK